MTRSHAARAGSFAFNSASAALTGTFFPPRRYLPLQREGGRNKVQCEPDHDLSGGGADSAAWQAAFSIST